MWGEGVLIINSFFIVTLDCTADLTMSRATFCTIISKGANMSLIDCHNGIYRYNGINFRLGFSNALTFELFLFNLIGQN